jgi:hypothetical protein
MMNCWPYGCVMVATSRLQTTPIECAGHGIEHLRAQVVPFEGNKASVASTRRASRQVYAAITVEVATASSRRSRA